MFVSLPHYFLPKIFGVLSLLLNPVFIYLVVSDRQTNIGNYKYLLVFFSMFDMTYSGVDMLIPIASHGSGYAFFVYLTDGIFVENVRVGQLAVSIRCGFIGLSYGILAIHFIYRYSLLFNTAISNKIRDYTGICYLIIFAIMHGIIWVIVCELTLYSDRETNDYVFESFKSFYKESSYKIPMLVAIYSGVSEPLVLRSWIGILILTGISAYAISTYLILGIKIIRKLGERESLSNINKKLYKQILKALIAQTSIPIIISFAPCLAAWYVPVFHIDLGMWINYTGVVSLAAFPFLDPLAIIFMLPNYKKRLFEMMSVRNTCTNSSSEQRVSSGNIPVP